MPWESTTVTEERVQFVFAYQREVLRGLISMAALCERFNVSRKTGYKWIERHQADGWRGLEDQSRAPMSGPHWIDEATREQILALKSESPDWGAKKIRALLEAIDEDRRWPSISGIHATLKREGLVGQPPRRRRYPHPGPAERLELAEPNQEWATDFKGQFRTRDRRYCFPLTIADGFSRYLLACAPLTRPTFEDTWRVFDRTFREYGLPEAIRSDNGTPFASASLRRLSRLSVRWIRLGIEPRLITPGKPQQNGRLERLHRTLKDAVCDDPAANCKAQKKPLDAFRERYNHKRPHESLEQKTPASRYTCSTRTYSGKLPQVDYPDGVEPRRVNSNGVVKWRRHEIFLSEVLHGENVGFELVDEGIWIVKFSFLALGYYSEHEKKFSYEYEVKQA